MSVASDNKASVPGVRVVSSKVYGIRIKALKLRNRRPIRIGTHSKGRLLERGVYWKEGVKSIITVFLLPSFHSIIYKETPL